MFSRLLNAFTGAANLFRVFCVVCVWLSSSAAVYAANGKVALALPVSGIAIDGNLSD